MRDGRRIVLVMPALDEAEALPGVLQRIPGWVDRVVVADNGSTDGTARLARALGAEVVEEPRRGYGNACLAGIRAAADADVLVFLDADGSDFPEDMARLVDPILAGQADLVIGARAPLLRQRGAMTPPQRFGNFLAPLLIQILWRACFTDLGPFRAIHAAALARLRMDAVGFGWTVQMQIRAARLGLRWREVSVAYARRTAGRSKISGTVRGVLGAGMGILACVAVELVRTLLADREEAGDVRAGTLPPAVAGPDHLPSQR